MAECLVHAPTVLLQGKSDARSQQGQRIVLQASAAQPASYPFDTWGDFPEAKELPLTTQPLSTAEVTNA